MSLTELDWTRNWLWGINIINLIFSRVKDNLLNEVVNSIKNWQKDNYHRTMMQVVFIRVFFGFFLLKKKTLFFRVCFFLDFAITLSLKKMEKRFKKIVIARSILVFVSFVCFNFFIRIKIWHSRRKKNFEKHFVSMIK